jgi:hypothetical protein
MCAARRVAPGRQEGGGHLDPSSAAAELAGARGAAEAAQAELRSLRHRDVALSAQLAEKTMEGLELRKQLHAARQSADPSIIQASTFWFNRGRLTLQPTPAACGR